MITLRQELHAAKLKLSKLDDEIGQTLRAARAGRARDIQQQAERQLASLQRRRRAAQQDVERLEGRLAMTRDKAIERLAYLAKQAQQEQDAFERAVADVLPALRQAFDTMQEQHRHLVALRSAAVAAVKESGYDFGALLTRLEQAGIDTTALTTAWPGSPNLAHTRPYRRPPAQHAVDGLLYDLLDRQVQQAQEREESQRRQYAFRQMVA